MDLSPRVDRIEPSATVDLIDRVNQLEAAGEDVINLVTGSQTEPGDPAFTTPEYIREAAKDSLDRGETHLAPSKGIPELREATARKLREENGLPTDADRVFVTPGAKYALFESVLALVSEGDEVVLLDPSWVSYKSMARVAGGRVSRVPLDADAGFAFDLDALAAGVSDDTRLLVLNTPHNPSGRVFPREALEGVRDLAVEHDFWVLADEIYEDLVFEGEHVSIGSLDGMDERTVTVNGFSKSFAMLGWRLGYFSAPPALVEGVGKLHSNSVSAVPVFGQRAAITALEGSREPTAEMRSTFRERRDVLLSVLRDAGVDVTAPDSGMYAFVPVGTEDDVAFCEALLEEEHVAITPGTAFGTPGYARVTFVLPPDDLREGLDRLVAHL